MYQYRRRYQGQLRAVVLDWAGTTVDHGCIAPVATFMEAFADSGVPISVAQARVPMGMPKWEHIQAITHMEQVAELWAQRHGKRPVDADVDDLYARFLPLQLAAVEKHSELIDGVLDVVDALRTRSIAIASTTGYPRAVMDVVLEAARLQGYEPDVTICAGETPSGRPGPSMALQALVNLSISPVEAVVKVGDTVVDIEEGLSGGMWTVGVAATGNEVGLSVEELQQLSAAERQRRCEAAAERLYRGGAHYVVDSIRELLPVLDAIDGRLAVGEKP